MAKTAYASLLDRIESEGVLVDGRRTIVTSGVVELLHWLSDYILILDLLLKFRSWVLNYARSLNKLPKIEGMVNEYALYGNTDNDAVLECTLYSKDRTVIQRKRFLLKLTTAGRIVDVLEETT